MSREISSIATDSKQAACSKKTTMVWLEEHDLLLCREIIVADPFETKKGTTQRSAKWAQVANQLAAVHQPQFKVDKRSVRDRYNLLAERLRQKLKREKRASGIETDMSEMEQALEMIIEKEDASEELQENIGREKQKQLDGDRKGAEDVRKKAMERLASTQKRKAEEDQGGQKVNKRRSNGSDTVQFLKERNEQQVKLQREKMEMDERKQAAEKERHSELINMMQAQQNQQMKTFEALMGQQQKFVQQQQTQQAALMLKLFEKMSAKK